DRCRHPAEGSSSGLQIFLPEMRADAGARLLAGGQTMKTNAMLGTAALLLHAIGLMACSDDGGGKGTGGGPSGSFAAATPPSDVCAMLTLSDVQAVLPDAVDGVEEKTADTSKVGFWARDCKWETTSGATSLELVIFGALT